MFVCKVVKVGFVGDSDSLLVSESQVLETAAHHLCACQNLHLRCHDASANSLSDDSDDSHGITLTEMASYTA